MAGIKKRRHIAKALTWRFVGTLDTFIISYIVSGSAQIGMVISGTELLTKTVLYYFHERVWYSYIPFGVGNER